MKNPIQNLLDRLNPAFSIEEHDIVEELICLAFSRGVQLGSKNVLEYYHPRVNRMYERHDRSVKWHLKNLRNEMWTDIEKLKESINKIN